MPTVVLLARQLKELRDHLDKRWDSAPSAKERATLLKQYKALDRETMRLISITVKEDGKEYAAATKKLEQANATLSKTLNTEKQIIAALDMAAKALDLVAKVIPA